MIDVRLTEQEMMTAAMLAFSRQLHAMRNGHTHRWGDKNRGWLNNVLGCFGEMAVAKHFNKFWSGGNHNLKLSDVGDLEVRYNSYWQEPYLRIYRQDKPDKKYILVTGEPPEFKIHGWFVASDAMTDRFATPPKGVDPSAPCWWVPAAMLRPISEIGG